jgi:hypothetical protein
MWDYFDPFAAGAIAIGFCELMNSAVMEGLTVTIALHQGVSVHIHKSTTR